MDKAIRSVLQKYATFVGRASRSEYWYWILAFWIGWYVVVAFTRLYPLYDFGLLIPTLAVGVRRLHDTNHSGWWLLVPLVNLLFLASPSVEPNRYGRDAMTQTRDPATNLGLTSDASASSSQSCPSCGTARQAGQNFCQSCGTKFD